MLNLIIRTFFIYIAVIVVMRLMGKRQVGQLQPFEMVVSIIIADLAAMPMQDEKIPLLRGIIPLVVLLFAQVVFSFIVFRNKKFRTWLNGTPSVLKKWAKPGRRAKLWKFWKNPPIGSTGNVPWQSCAAGAIFGIWTTLRRPV